MSSALFFLNLSSLCMINIYGRSWRLLLWLSVVREDLQKMTIMIPEDAIEKSNETLINAAKYICTLKCGMCPMAVEKFPCPQVCTVEVKPWQCWIAYFQRDQHPISENE